MRLIPSIEKFKGGAEIKKKQNKTLLITLYLMEINCTVE
jgi:hypothetical protein